MNCYQHLYSLELKVIPEASDILVYAVFAVMQVIILIMTIYMVMSFGLKTTVRVGGC